MTNDNDRAFYEIAEATQEIDRLKAENFKLRGELGSIRSGSAKVVSFKESEIKALKAENARLEAALKGLDGKEWKELMEPTIELMQQLEAYYHQYYSPNWPTPFKDVGKELARLRGLVPEANKTTPLTSS